MSLFQPNNDEAIDFIASHPFAFIVSRMGDSLFTTPLPLIFKDDRDDKTLVGHFARANPHVAALKESSEAIAIFHGSHSYISPSWMRDRTQAPTWNFQFCEVHINIQFDDTQNAADDAVALLTKRMEADRPRAWSPPEMGQRYDKLIKHIIPFHADILSLRAKFKLGQNERNDVFEDILIGLKDESNSAVADLMTQFRSRTP